LQAPDSQRLALVSRLVRLEDEYQQATAALAVGEAEVKHLRGKLNELPATQTTGVTQGFSNQAADTIRAQLFTLQDRAEEMSKRYGPQHSDLVALRKQLAAAQANYEREQRNREQVTTGPNRLHEETQMNLLRQENQLASLRARADTLGRQREQVQQDLKALARNELRLKRMQRDLDVLVSNYGEFAGNRGLARIDRALEEQGLSNISIVQPATYDVKPVRPNVLLNMGLGFGLALAGGVSLGLLLEYRRQGRPTDAPPPPAAPAASLTDECR
jgi:uncharacterized protein involved in exopolysaccharide biosynthesis